MKTWIGLPEEDGGIPILIVLESQNHHFTFIDTLGRKEEPILSIDRPHLYIETLKQYPDRFYEVKEELVSEVCSRAYSTLDQISETWDVFRNFMPPPQKLPTLPALMDVQDIDVSGLMSAEHGICIAIPDNVLLEGLRGIQVVKKIMTQQKRPNRKIFNLLMRCLQNADLAVQHMHEKVGSGDEWWGSFMTICILKSHKPPDKCSIFSIHNGSQTRFKKLTDIFFKRNCYGKNFQKHDCYQK